MLFFNSWQTDIPLPDLEGRRDLLKINLKTVKLADDIDIEELAQHTEGYSGADITLVKPSLFSSFTWLIVTLGLP